MVYIGIAASSQRSCLGLILVWVVLLFFFQDFPCVFLYMNIYVQVRDRLLGARIVLICCVGLVYYSTPLLLLDSGLKGFNTLK